MTLKILLPYQVFAEWHEVSKIIVKTTEGSLGILPRRLDGVASIVPGILQYENEAHETKYIAVDEGILIKTGDEVLVSVRNAVAGANLGMLKKSVDEEFKVLAEKEKNVRSVLVKMESHFIRSFEKLRHS